MDPLGRWLESWPEMEVRFEGRVNIPKLKPPKLSWQVVRGTGSNPLGRQLESWPDTLGQAVHSEGGVDTPK